MSSLDSNEWVDQSNFVSNWPSIESIEQNVFNIDVLNGFLWNAIIPSAWDLCNAPPPYSLLSLSIPSLKIATRAQKKNLILKFWKHARFPQ